MIELKMIREAMLRLSSIGQNQYFYDPDNEISGEGPIHFLVQIGDQLFIAWKNNETGTMIVNPITRFDLYALEELGSEEAWVALIVPREQTVPIQFREVSETELGETYRRMDGVATIPIDLRNFPMQTCSPNFSG